MLRVRQLGVIRNRARLALYQFAIRAVHAAGYDSALDRLLHAKLAYVRRLHGVGAVR